MWNKIPWFVVRQSETNKHHWYLYDEENKQVCRIIQENKTSVYNLHELAFFVGVDNKIRKELKQIEYEQCTHRKKFFAIHRDKL